MFRVVWAGEELLELMEALGMLMEALGMNEAEKELWASTPSARGVEIRTVVASILKGGLSSLAGK